MTVVAAQTLWDSIPLAFKLLAGLFLAAIAFWVLVRQGTK